MKKKALLLLSFLGIAILLGACNKDLALDQEELQLAVGETAVLAVQGADPDAVEWSSSTRKSPPWMPRAK